MSANSSGETCNACADAFGRYCLIILGIVGGCATKLAAVRPISSHDKLSSHSLLFETQLYKHNLQLFSCECHSAHSLRLLPCRKFTSLAANGGLSAATSSLRRTR